jgi:hypothetical protein
MGKYVSPCCGEDYKEDDQSYCCCAQISESGICYECKEHAEPSEGYICEECEEYFEETETEYEYHQKRKESHDEDLADTKRKYDE